MRPNGSVSLRDIQVSKLRISAAQARAKCFNCATPLAAWRREDVGCCTRLYCTPCLARYVRGQVLDVRYPVEGPAVLCAKELRAWKAVNFLREQGMNNGGQGRRVRRLAAGRRLGAVGRLVAVR